MNINGLFKISTIYSSFYSDAPQMLGGALSKKQEFTSASGNWQPTQCASSILIKKNLIQGIVNSDVKNLNIFQTKFLWWSSSNQTIGKRNEDSSQTILKINERIALQGLLDNKVEGNTLVVWNSGHNFSIILKVRDYFLQIYFILLYNPICFYIYD